MENIDIFNYFPMNVRRELEKEINLDSYNELEEIRIRVNRPIVLNFKKEQRILNYIVQTRDILNILNG